MATYLYGAAFLIGLTLTYFALKQYQLTARLVSSGMRAEAEVTAFLTVKDSEGDTFKPIFEFTDSTGAQRQFESDIAYAEPSVKIGDKVSVYYHQDPEIGVKQFSFWGLYRWTVLFLVFASPFLIIGGGYLLFILRHN